MEPTDEQDAGATRDASLRVERAPLAASVNKDPQRVRLAGRFAVEAARSLSDDKCEDVLVLDLRGVSQMTDYFVLATGTSERQMKSASEHVRELGRELGLEVYHSNLREGPTTWFIIDFVDVVVHVFDEEQRAFYDLEMLWGDAARVEWTREGKPYGAGESDARNRAGLRDDDVLPE